MNQSMFVDFLNEGKRRAAESKDNVDTYDVAVDITGQGEERPVAYFIGKLLWVRTWTGVKRVAIV